MALSGGERRRCEIARALAGRPSFMLLDEPFAGIDPIAVGGIQDLVRHLKERGIGVLITDHSVRETLGLTDRAYIIYNGHVLTEGTPEAIIADPNVRRFFIWAMISGCSATGAARSEARRFLARRQGALSRRRVQAFFARRRRLVEKRQGCPVSAPTGMSDSPVNSGKACDQLFSTQDMAQSGWIGVSEPSSTRYRTRTGDTNLAASR